MQDRTRKRDERDRRRRKRWPVHGRSLEAIMNGERKRMLKLLEKHDRLH